MLPAASFIFGGFLWGLRPANAPKLCNLLHTQPAAATSVGSGYALPNQRHKNRHT